MKPTAADYLQSREGATWTADDTEWMLSHLRAVDELASEVIRKLLRERAK